MGDIVLTVPAIDGLIEAAHWQRVTCVTSDAGLALLPDRFPTAEVFSIEDEAVSPLFRTDASADALWHQYIGPVARAVFWINDPDLVRSGITRLGIHDALVTSPRPASGQRVHQSDLLARSVGLPVGRSPSLRPTKSDIAEVTGLLRRAGFVEQPVVLHVGAGGRSKRWPALRYAELARRLAGVGLEVGLLEGPADGDAVQAVARDAPLARRLPPVPLRQLPAYLSLAKAVVGNDSGPCHVSASVGTPTVSLFGPTDPAVWAPRGPASITLEAPGGDFADLPTSTVVAALWRVAGWSDPPGEN